MVTRDVRPRAVLDEWLDRGMVAIDGEGRIRLEEAAFAPRAGDDRQLYYFGRNLHDHAAAAVENILSSEPPYFERAVHYEGVSSETAESDVGAVAPGRLRGGADRQPRSPDGVF